ncbi:polyphosphate kinase 2 family protein [Neptuniibacter halophilus]|uniref:polyphosphate kinase 2 family protein n=1 Tax=Neptuniibacter halophilus TaxID=651666 RepID=UPI0025740502|nr:PPK2 family polyphosphate kinase [Neptuniibacter halophilus]
MHQPSPIILQSSPPTLSQADFVNSCLPDKETYHQKLKKWQKRMLKVQQAYYHQNKRAILVFEGWDASGKGGAIRRITEKLDPRGVKVHPISAPSPEEQSKHYLQRFQARLPEAGAIAIFDRSWYGRLLVERVEGFASEQEWQRAYQEINEFERSLIDDGARIIKIFMHISPDEQLKRFSERLNNPVKRWKLTTEDIRNRERWSDYAEATEDMFRYTSTEAAPWHIVTGNRKWFARVDVLKTVVKQLAQGVDVSPPPLDPEVTREAYRALGIQVTETG